MTSVGVDGKNRLMQLQTEEEVDKYFQDQAHFMIAKRKMETIDNFNGVFDFLNNEYPCDVYYQGRMYPSVFHAFQAARSDKDHERAKIGLAESMQELYELATEIEDPPDWQTRRLLIMETCIRDKFRRNRELRDRLRKTGNRELINSYSDRSTSNLFWGIVDNKGHNHLGKILETVRLDVHSDKELEKWLASALNPQADKQLLPTIKVDVFKEGKLVGTESLKRMPWSIFGALAECDVVLAHPTVSRKHLCVLVDAKLGVVILDLGSKAGTFLNGERIEANLPVAAKDGDQFAVAESTRTYTLRIDFSEVQALLEKKHRSLQMDLKILSLQQSVGSGEELVKASLGLIKQDTIFLSNLPDNTSDKEVREVFGQFGKIVEVRIPLHRQSGQSKGIAFLRYFSEDEAKSAFKAVRIPMRDRLVKIQFAEKNKGQILGELEREVQRGQREPRDKHSGSNRGKSRRSRKGSSDESDDSRHRTNYRASERKKESRRPADHPLNGRDKSKNKSHKEALDANSHRRSSRSRDRKRAKGHRKDSSSSIDTKGPSRRRKPHKSVSGSSSSDLSD